MMYSKSKKGFTLIELLITIAIIGILSAIAVPSYRNYIVQARRSDAQQELVKLASALENCFSLNNTYLNCLTDTGNDNVSILPSNVSQYYVFDGSGIQANTYDISVVATGSQTRDESNCHALGINSLGRKFSASSVAAYHNVADEYHCW